ncbi:tRNA lysidine(34) synthetase TilS [Arthrobacter pityocampae]|uniref:tRNA(Ile)-lysidine synthase n=1 Tax=Arthrobacter pityocampae TaxID=547334 RepID=A0A2S5IVB4_9MICC|nr:tRNA lysidine(34) synthetase TilS [Arthrobacter pityocampae]PPB48481.1 tRNA lysidine(34) synthetase TilS [Arthrobacter pityocampae]
MARRPRLLPAVGTARNLLAASLEGLLADPAGAGERGTPADPTDLPLVLVACSGGPDSLALAAVAAHLAHTGRCRVGAVVVDHGLQAGSAGTAGRAAAAARDLGLDPVEVHRVTVERDGMGPEAAARGARYAALDDAASRLGAVAVLLGHTLDDQAEQVLLGLARGSGTRSLAGMPESRGPYLRPFLDLRRADTEAICAFYGLDPWHDPTNLDPSYARSRVRGEVLPFLEDRLGPGIARALARTARILGQDADLLEQLSAEAYASLRTEGDDGTVLLPEDGLRSLPAALRQRVLALAALELGAFQPSFERLRAAESLLDRKGSAGPVQLGGKVSVHRQVRGRSVLRGQPSYGSLVLRNNGSSNGPGGQQLRRPIQE